MVGGKAWPGYLNVGQTHVLHTLAESTARGKSGQFCSVLAYMGLVSLYKHKMVKFYRQYTYVATFHTLQRITCYCHAI